MGLHEAFWSASLQEWKQGYMEQEEHVMCLLCGEQVEKGIIYPVEGALYEASRFMRHHIEVAHGSVFTHLSQLDKRLTGLSDHQISLLRLFYQGKTDAEVQKEMGIGSASTIRNHRFALKEKERQAKVFLVMMELLHEADKNQSSAQAGDAKSGKQKNSVKDGDAAEYAAIVTRFLPNGLSGRLERFPRKQKHKLILLEEISKKFELGRFYTEPEVNEMLEGLYDDYVTLRRYLVDFGLMDRQADGSQYWRIAVANEGEEREEQQMNRKQELKQMYKELEVDAGVYQIKNKQNDKVFIASTNNLKTINGRKFMLQQGSHTNRELQKDWDKYGADAFEFEVLEKVEKKDHPYFDVKDALEKLEDKWMKKLAPYGDRGYHVQKDPS
ncbi:DUF2087 domain-containing protein [Brevibacillus sp. 179-C9.3 HS]|uniref:DUF2087 domain-containing protein n=1 Tax=unclassified Brevibacillus TaxID=2684853 RepID=UPI0039A27D91